MKSSEKNRAIIAESIARAWREPEFLSQLKNNPVETLRNAGADIPPDMKVVVLENSPTTFHVALPLITGQDKIEDSEQKAVERSEKIAAGRELRVSRDTEGLTHIVIPVAPSVSGALSDEVLEQIAGGDCEAVSTNTTQTAEVETTECAVTETTQTQDCETTTTFAAEAELVVVLI